MNTSVAGSKVKARTRARALENSFAMRPSEILFSQDTGFATFSDGRWVAQTLYEIVTGQLEPASLPLLRVVRAEDGLFSLDNRRLYCFRECNRLIGRIDVELVEVSDAGIAEEYKSKRYGMGNGTTSQGTVLRIKPDDTGNTKNALAATAALQPCTLCGSSAMERLRQVQFVKGSKKAILNGDSAACGECLKLVSFCKKGKGRSSSTNTGGKGGNREKKSGKEAFPPELQAAMDAAKIAKAAKKKKKKKQEEEKVPEGSKDKSEKAISVLV